MDFQFQLGCRKVIFARGQAVIRAVAWSL